MMWRFAHLWDRALAYEQFVRESQEHCDLWTGVYRAARTPDWAIRRAAALGRGFRLVAIAEDWCGDASSTVPVVARWADSVANVEVRILRRDENPELMDAYLTSGSRSIPIVIVLTREMEEVGRWGPRPSALQALVMEQRTSRGAAEYYPELRRWYAKDRGDTTLREILEVMAQVGTGEPGRT